MVEVLEVRARFDGQFRDQGAAQAGVGLQCVGLAAAAVQGQHQLPVQLLPQRLAGGQLAQFPDQFVVPAQRQLRPQPGVQRRGPGFRQAYRGGLQQRAVRGVGGQRAPPQGQRPAVQVGGACRVAGRLRGPAAGVEALELGHVQPGPSEVEGVAGRAGEQGARALVGIGRAQDLAQLGHVHLEGGGRGARRVRRPQLVDQRARGDHLARPHQQRGQHHPKLCRPRGMAHPGGLAGEFHRSEEPEIHQSGRS